MTTPYTFPFGEPVRIVRQTDCHPKRVFILGVYASAVHARWVAANGTQRVRALAVASEPYIFWRGEGVSSILARIHIPPALGKLLPAQEHLNGPTGKALDALFLMPLGLTRADVWLCDLIPHSCQNDGQRHAIEREYQPYVLRYGLPAVTVPTVPKQMTNPQRRREILDEIQQADPDIIILLGDLPIRWFLRFFDERWPDLSSFGTTPQSYGQLHPVRLADRQYQVLPLVHPKQAAALGSHSPVWKERHCDWLEHIAPGLDI